MRKDSVSAMQSFEDIKFGILKTSTTLFPSVRCLVEAVGTTDNGMLHCVTADKVPAQKQNKGIPVTLKFANKETGVYILAKALCFTGNVVNGQTQLNLQIREAQWFEKKTVSRYTSFLKNIYTYSVGRIIPRNGFGVSKVA